MQCLCTYNVFRPNLYDLLVPDQASSRGADKMINIINIIPWNRTHHFLYRCTSSHHISPTAASSTHGSSLASATVVTFSANSLILWKTSFPSRRGADKTISSIQNMP